MFLYIECAPQGAHVVPGITVKQGYYELHTPQIFVRLRVRTAYPQTYCRALPNGSFEFGYGTAGHSNENEFLAIEASADGHLRIKRDCFVTLPLFYTQQDSTLKISNSYDAVFAATSLRTLDRQRVLRMLGPDKEIFGTLWREIRMLTERQTLDWRDGKLHITNPPARSWSVSNDATPTDPHEFAARLNNHFDYFYSSRLQGNAFCFELSGGLDSCTLPLYLRKYYPELSLQTISLVFQDENANQQQMKLAALQAQINAQALQLPLSPERNFPLARYIRDNRPTQFSPYDILHYECNEGMARIMQMLGVTVVATGVGGDDVLENIVTPEQNYSIGRAEATRMITRLPSFVTSKFKDEWQEAVSTAQAPTLPLLPTSELYIAACSRHNIYIEHDVWPVSPFISPALYAFCQGLPIHMRANKNILRAYHQAHQFPPEIYNTTETETFDGFLRDCFQGGNYAETMQYFMRHSPLIKAGYIDVESIKEFYELIPTTDIGMDAYYSIYTWLSVELSLARAGRRTL